MSLNIKRTPDILGNIEPWKIKKCIQQILADNVRATQRGEGYQMHVMSLLGAIVFYAFAFVALCTFVFGGVSFSQYQTKINKRKFGKVALTISLVCLAVSIIGTLVIIFVKRHKIAFFVYTIIFIIVFKDYLLHTLFFKK